MYNGQPDVIVAGHLCLDIIPGLTGSGEGNPAVPSPGRLAFVGPAVTSTGGCVSNTGLALNRLGVATALLGKVGDDLLGSAAMGFIRQRNEQLVHNMIITKDEHSSYTIVMNPPDADRSFMHFPGPNDTFAADDVDYALVSTAKMFHFGYPPLMRLMFDGNGKELTKLFRQAKETGVTTSLDMAQPDLQSPAGQADWLAILKATLPHVDLFLPSLDEILFMVDRRRFEQLDAMRAAHEGLDCDLCAELAETLIGMGAAIVCLKLGGDGLYLRSTKDIGRIESMGRGAPAEPGQWADRELMAPCFQVEVAGATGSGDCTIAGFLASWIRDLSPSQVMNFAVAVGANSVEQKDATSGVRSWEETALRMKNGWPRLRNPIRNAGWVWDEASGVWVGPRDVSHR